MQHPIEEMMDQFYELKDELLASNRKENELRAQWPATCFETLDHHYKQRNIYVDFLTQLREEVAPLMVPHGDDEWEYDFIDGCRWLAETINDLNELIEIGKSYIEWAGLDIERPSSWDARSIGYFDETGKPVTVH